MPYKSREQAAYMHIHHPEISEEWDEKYYGKGRKKRRRRAIEEMGKTAGFVSKADFFGRQGVKNANDRLRNADKLADKIPNEQNIRSAKFAAKMRNKALLKRTTRIAPLALIPAAAGALAVDQSYKRRGAAQTYGSGAYAAGTGQ